MDRVRIGVLGAARIAPAAIIRPARLVADAEVVSIAARDTERAQAFAAKHGVAKVVGSYEELVTDPDIDAVYNPLPNGLHGRWTLAAIAAGKHVLCEKPFTANAEEAETVAVAARQAGVVVMEAFHYRYHPLFVRTKEAIDSGTIGAVQRIETSMCFPLPFRHDIRWNPALAGGATMDAGCYAIHQVRHLAGAEPQVVSARALLRSPGIDRAMDIEFRFADGRSASATCSMWSSRLLSIGVRIIGERGEVRVFNLAGPQAYHRLTIRPAGMRRTVEHVTRRPTYAFQLEAFTDAVLRGVPPVTGLDDAVANMTVIDDVYRAAGLEPRVPTA